MNNILHPTKERFYHRNESIKLNTLKKGTWLSILIIVLFVSIFVMIFWYGEQVNKLVSVQPVYANAPKDRVEEVVNAPTQEEIENYIKVIFGKDARVGIAVSHNECNPANKQYPYCVLHTEHEYSVGIWQINLFNAKHWIHAKKVPGNTMAEKIEWLKNPYNNTLIAYKIFKDSGWNPWSAYTNGNYLKSL